MADDLDHYEAWYSEKLWNLLPAIYRADDSDDFDNKGPLRELVDRIGAQAAIVRRSIDRLWEDQSIETCDDWVIAYLGDLLATNLVASLDARGRRVDVGKTINYRRRKGTVGLLEELAGDISGWSVRVVEFFRRMQRSRHLLDPAIGFAAPATTSRGKLQREQGLVGSRTGTCIGGYADLRDVDGAMLANSPFDEYFHTADVRRGRGVTGRYNIAKLGVFVWRLRPFAVSSIAAVHDKHCKNQYTFDPTGRDIPLFAAGEHPTGDRWVSPIEDQVPGPISAPLLRTAFTSLYRDEQPEPKEHSLAVYRVVVGPPDHDDVFVRAGEIERDPRQPTTSICIDPARGRIIAPVGTTTDEYRVNYHYGFSSEIGAGPYDRRIPRDPRARRAPPMTAQPELRVKYGADLDTRLGELAGLPGAPPVSGTIWIEDSRTYTAVRDVGAIKALAIRARNLCRPVIRSAAARWSFTGNDESSTLELDGIFVSGGTEIVLSGKFARVKLTCCTFDPGTWAPPPTPPLAPPPSPWLLAADDRELSPSRLRIDGNVTVLEIDRCIIAPISDGGTFAAKTVTIDDSIIQAADRTEFALSLVNGELALSRCTVLGRGRVHRLDASESILHDVVTVDDTQHGCVRFTAWSTASELPRKYESVEIPARANLFNSLAFGRPEFAQLIATVASEISEGAEDGSEMGAFSREKTAIKERSILIKYQEYLPLGLEPVIVHLT